MKKHTVRRVLLLIRPYRFTVVGSLLLALASVASQLLIPIFSGRAIDAMVGKGRVDLDAVALAVAAIALIALLGALAQDMLARCNNRITFSVSRDLRSRISSKLNRLPLSYLDTHPTGDTVSRTVADVEAFADGLLMGFTQLFTGVLTVLATLVVMLVLNWRIALAVCLLTPLSIFIAKYITSRTSRFFRAQARIRGEQTALINELIEGQRVVRAFGHEAAALADFDAVNDRLEKASLSATFFSSLTNPTTRLANNLVYAVVTLISALNAIAGGISVGQVSVFLSYASQYAKPFNEISGVVTELQNALTCADRVFELLDLPDEQPDCADPVSPEARGAVRLDKVCFRYVPERPLISDFSLDVRPGQRIAIVGPTGCGKTTLINLLMRFYDVDSGAISVDGADIRRMTRHDLRGRYGMVLQDTWLATATVRENITYGKPDATDAEIEAAAKAAYAHSFIRRLPQGYDTVIRENDLSAGQRQLICIARVMLCLPPMLILDEATSSVDILTEQKIQKAFLTMMQGRTSFIIAHRLSTIRHADRILVLEHGDVAEIGTHEELLRRDGAYSRLYKAQFAPT